MTWFLQVRFPPDQKKYPYLFDAFHEFGDVGSNVVVGGENRWTYDSFVNYEFFGPSQLPILVYFKETQTPEEQWSVVSLSRAAFRYIMF